MDTKKEKAIHNRKEKGNGVTVKRSTFLDVLRVVATCAVVLLHTLTGAVDAVDINQYPVERIVFLVTMDLITWCVPIFVLISGYLFLNPTKTISFSKMLTKYCRRIVLALFVFGVPFAMLELILVERTLRLSMVWQGFVMVLQGKSWSHMWYLYMILFLYLLTPVLKWILERVPKGCVYAVMIFLLLFSSIFTFLNKLLGVSLPVLPDAGIYLFYYLCGYLFACGDGSSKQQEKKQCGKTEIFALIVMMLLLGGMALSRICRDFSVQMAYNYPFTVLVAVLMFYVCKNSKACFSERTANIWRRMSELSFTIYLVHPVFVNILYKFLHVSLLEYPIGIALPVFFAVILVLAIITAWILCRISVLKKYIL